MVSLYNKDYHCNNVSSSLLINSRVGDFVAYSIDDYIEKAVRLANARNPVEYDHIHRQFTDLMNPKMFMESYENTLAKLYHHHWISMSKT
jgi:predicted O-linked N-acetylglucosamine transferase (SPINDLY family)